MFVWKRVLLALVFVVGCGSKEKPKPTPAPKKPDPTPTSVSTPPASTPTSAPASTPAASAPSQPAASLIITPQQMGKYKLGDAPPGVIGGNPAGDVVTSTDGEIEISSEQGKTNRICALTTKSPQYKTPEGLGVGSTFGDFEKAYGSSTVEAATGRIFFPGKAETFDIQVENMPNEGDKKPEAASKVLSITITDCPREPE